jgi:ABC-2 type transport system permease protein
MSKFLNLLKKELRELITLRMIVPFIVMILLLTLVGRMVGGEMKRSQGSLEIGVANNDPSALADSLIQALVAGRCAVVPLAPAAPETVIARAADLKLKIALIIPRDFERDIRQKRGARLQIYAILKSLSLSESVQKASIRRLISILNDRISDSYIRGFAGGLDPVTVKQPITADEFVVLRGKITPGEAEALIGMIMGLNFMLPVILMMLIIFAGQMVASSLGQEKENKTLETMLTVPVSRVSIVAAKMLAAAILALVLAGLYMVSFGDYMSSFTASSGGPSLSQIVAMSRNLNLSLSAGSYLLLGVNIFLTIICALSLATLLALFAEDTKGAQAMLTPLMVIVLIPYFFSLFLDPRTVSLPLKIFINVLPFSHTFFAFRYLLFGDVVPVMAGILYLAALSLVLIIAAARIFSSDRILTMRLSFGRKRTGG